MTEGRANGAGSARARAVALSIALCCLLDLSCAQDAHCQDKTSSPATIKAQLAPEEEHLLVRLAAGADKQHIADLLREVRGTVVDTITTDDATFTVLVVAAEKGKTPDLLKKLQRKKDKDISRISANSSLTFEDIGPAGTDPQRSNQWGLVAQAHQAAINLAPKTLRPIELTFIDSGIRRMPTRDEMSNISQFNCVQSPVLPEAPRDAGGPTSVGHRPTHGTGVASVAAATTGNGVGISGVASAGEKSSIHVTMLRVSDGKRMQLASILRALAWCTRHRSATGVHGPINISIYPLNANPDFQDLCGKLKRKGCLVIICSGNDGTYDTSLERNCVRVNGLQSAARIHPYFTSGPFDTAAPGVNIKAYANHGHDAAYMSGTSFAAPHWAGALGYLMSVHPNANVSALQIHNIIRATSFRTIDGRWLYPNMRAAAQAILGK